MQRYLLAFLMLTALPHAGWAAAAGPTEPMAAAKPMDAVGTHSPIPELIEHTARLRGLTFQRPVEWEVLAADAMREKFVATQLEADEIALTEKVLKKFGLMPAEMNLHTILVALLEEQVAGFYDPDVGKLFALDPQGLPMFQQLGPAAAEMELNHTLLHELVHALQDQTFILTRFIDDDALKSGAILDDAVAARLAVAEGDATMVALDYSLQQMSPQTTGITSMSLPPDMLAGLMDSMASSDLPGTEALGAAPPYLRKSLFFPYSMGFRFVTHLRREGGWARVNTAYTQPPESTEQILHVERYGTDHPTPVPPFRLGRVLGDTWRPERASNLGELDIRLLMQEHVDNGRAEAVSTGWDGDRVATFTHADAGEVLIVWASVWDSETEAQEFADAYVSVLASRYGTARARAEHLWNTPAGEVSLERRGPWVVVVDALPRAARRRVTAHVWAAVEHIQPTP